MGAAIPAILAVTSVASAGASIVGRVAGANAQNKALRLQETEARIKANSDALKRQSELRHVLGAQNASIAARGISAASPSFAAIKAEDFNQFAIDERLSNLTLKLQEDSIEQAKSNVMTNAIMGSAGDIFTAANAVGNAKSINDLSKKHPASQLPFSTDENAEASAASKNIINEATERNFEILPDGAKSSNPFIFDPSKFSFGNPIKNPFTNIMEE